MECCGEKNCSGACLLLDCFSLECLSPQNVTPMVPVAYSPPRHVNVTTDDMFISVPCLGEKAGPSDMPLLRYEVPPPLPSDEVEASRRKIFGVCLENSYSCRCKYLKKENLLLVGKSSKFVINFQFKTPPPPQSVVEAIVCCKAEEDVTRKGPVVKCKKHSAADGEGNFLTSANKSVVYSYHGPHQVTRVPVEAMLVGSDRYACVYMCNCYSTCFLGRRQEKASLIIMLTLLSRTGEVLDYDTINLRCCAGPKRDEGRTLKRALVAEHPANKAKRAKLPPTEAKGPSLPLLPEPAATVNPSYNFIDGDKPDKDGYFTFTWKLKDPFIYNLLKMMKQGHSML